MLLHGATSLDLQRLRGSSLGTRPGHSFDSGLVSPGSARPATSARIVRPIRGGGGGGQSPYTSPYTTCSFGHVQPSSQIATTLTYSSATDLRRNVIGPGSILTVTRSAVLHGASAAGIQPTRLVRQASPAAPSTCSSSAAVQSSPRRSPRVASASPPSARARTREPEKAASEPDGAAPGAMSPPEGVRAASPRATRGRLSATGAVSGERSDPGGEGARGLSRGHATTAEFSGSKSFGGGNSGAAASSPRSVALRSPSPSPRCGVSGMSSASRSTENSTRRSTSVGQGDRAWRSGTSNTSSGALTARRGSREVPLLARRGSPEAMRPGPGTGSDRGNLRNSRTQTPTTTRRPGLVSPQCVSPRVSACSSRPRQVFQSASVLGFGRSQSITRRAAILGEDLLRPQQQPQPSRQTLRQQAQQAQQAQQQQSQQSQQSQRSQQLQQPEETQQLQQHSLGRFNWQGLDGEGGGGEGFGDLHAGTDAFAPEEEHGILAECDTNSPTRRRRPMSSDEKLAPKKAAGLPLSLEPRLGVLTAPRSPLFDDGFQGTSLFSPSPSTVDIHGPASLGHVSSAPSLLSGAGALELSESLSTPSLNFSTNSSKEDGSSFNGGRTRSQRGSTGRRTPELLAREARSCKHHLPAASDENQPPSESLVPTPCTSEACAVETGNPDPLAQTVMTIGAVSTMRYFWENKTRLSSGGKDGDSSCQGTRPRRSCSSIPSRQTGLRRLKSDISRLQSHVAESKSLVEQLEIRVRGAHALSPPSLLSDGSPSSSLNGSSSDSGDSSKDGEEHEGILVWKAFNQNTSALWKIQNKTMQLLLEHMDRTSITGETCAADSAGRTHGHSAPAMLEEPFSWLAATGSESPAQPLEDFADHGITELEEPAEEPFALAVF